jgi:nitroreductase
MAGLANGHEATAELLKVRQSRQYLTDPLSEETIELLLQVARWSGSSSNSQPWHFVAVTDRALLRELSTVRGDATAWVATAPLAIAIVLNGKSQVSEAFDEGRATERLLIAAHFLGLGGGTAWFGDASQQARAKEILGIPAELTARSVVVLGHTAENPAPSRRVSGGRKPLAEVASRDRYPAHKG